jgi:hypothetical protein
VRIEQIGRCVLVSSATLLLAGSAAAGGSALRLNGAFRMEDATQGDANEGCVIASFQAYQALGRVLGTTVDGCGVSIVWNSFAPNKGNASVLKDDDTGTARVSQQVETEVEVSISGAECPTAPYAGSVQPEKCKSSSSVSATEGPDTVQQGKASVSCELGSDGSELVPSPTTAQLGTVVGAFAERSDVKLTDSGKLTIKTKGEGDLTAFCD